MQTWMEALHFCRRECSDLADLQAVGEADVEELRILTTNTQEAWIGLYFSAATGALKWSSDLGDGIPAWLKVPKMGVGLCAGLGVFQSYTPRVYVASCSVRQPFICFYGAWTPLGLG